MRYIYPLNEIPKEKMNSVGGKASSLATMITDIKVPVPEGYVITKEAFDNGRLSDDAEKELELLIRSLNSGCTYAVRSSAIGEDGKKNSFAGQFETVTDVRKENITKALDQVLESYSNARSSVYSESFGTGEVEMAVVIQRFVNPEYAGVIFTSDPITGRDDKMNGNFVEGEGEKLVSGSENAAEFKIGIRGLKYEGPAEMAPYGKKLGKACRKIRNFFGIPMDIEWAVSGGRVYILQARPITTLLRCDFDTFEINGSYSAHKLLTKTNVGEVFLTNVSPMTFSIIDKMSSLLGLPEWLDCVAGQPYMNISVMCSMLMSLGFSKERAINTLKDLSGNTPEDLEVPATYFDAAAFRRCILKLLFPKKRSKLSRREKHKMVQELDSICRDLIVHVRTLKSNEELTDCWDNLLIPKLSDGLASVLGESVLSLTALFSTKKKIARIADEETANALCSGCTGILDSMKPILYLEDVAKGEMSREEYLKLCGHRCALEMEISQPRPYENPEILDRLLKEYADNPTSLREKQIKENELFKKNLAEFKAKYPLHKRHVDRMLARFVTANEFREDIRSKGVYIFCVFREFLLKTGEINGLGDDVFMLTFDEVFRLLKGDASVTSRIPARRKTYEKQSSYPSFPNILLGRFDPNKWLEDPGRRNDLYTSDSSTSSEKDIAESTDGTTVIKGFPGASGRITGVARVIDSIQHIDEIMQGDILVTNATNIGWTLAFPKVTAIVTDIGAPLSHAAIVAREFGIPAVVGCGNATTLIKTGDRICVDGGAGSVTIICSHSSRRSLRTDPDQSS